MITTILGSNSGDRYRLLQEAVRRVATVGKVVKASSYYETEPWGFESDNCFLNRVVAFDTSLSPTAFLHHCLETEKELGRVRTAGGPRYTSRPIDIDILFCDSQVIQTPDLVVPHPRLCERRFVLVPLAEIMPDFIHPTSRTSVQTLLEQCTDHSEVKLYLP